MADHRSGGGKRKRPGGGRGRRSSFLSRFGFEIFLGLAVFALTAAIWILASGRLADQGDEYVESDVDKVQSPDQIIEEARVAPSDTARVFDRDKPQSPRPRIALIIDDLGADPEAAEELLALDAPLVFSVLPHLKFSRSIAKDAAERGRVVMLHLPMEPKSQKAKPGPGALLVKQGRDEILDVLRGDIASVPGAVGVNNHMGSRFTESGAKAPVVMEELKRRGLFFVDSRTTAGTVAYRTAVEKGVPAAERDVFLDNDRDVNAISENIMTLADLAIKKGFAIGIGHPYPETIAALKASIPAVREMGVEIAPVTEMLVVE